LIVEGKVDRAKLSQKIRATPELLKKVEAAIHPLVALDRETFRKAANAPFVLFDIPQQKRELADFVIETDGSFDDTREQVHQILEKLRSQ